MSLEVIYVVRHGFRTSWLVDPNTGVYSASIPSPTGIAADPALTSHGVAQAKELAVHLMTVDPPIEAVYSSPYYRCLQTITPFMELKRHESQDISSTCDAVSAPSSILPEYGLSEWFGSAPFDHPVPASPEVLKAMFPAYDKEYVSALTPSRRGETVDELYGRVERAVQAIIDRCDGEGRRAVVLCTHAAVVIALGRVLTRNIPASVETEDFHAFTCGLSVYRRQRLQGSPVASGSSVNEASASGRWYIEKNSDCSFLSSGEERGWKFAGDESFPGTGSMSQADTAAKL